MLGRGADSSEAIDDAGQRALIDAAKNAGVEHFIFTSVRGASPDYPVDFWRTKYRVERYLASSGLAWTIVRPTAFIEMHAYELIGKAVLNGRRVVMFGPGTNPRNFVAARDVAALIALAIEDESLRGEIIEIGGPENLTANQVAETFEKLGGRKAKVSHLPLGLVRLLSRAFRPLHPGVSRIMSAGVVSETTDQAFDPTTFPARYSIALTPLDEWARVDLRQRNPD
jgi:NADH dehydrogenase